MSDEELEEYINKIEPNFDSHLEKGTIEMSNEYYNLLEEKMVRIINKNQSLKEQVDYLRRSIERKEETIIELEHERVPYTNEYVEELKKELEEYKRLGFEHLNDKCNKLENQQKEFIEFLENEKDRLAR